MSRFNHDLFKKWIKALRSGKYKQGRGRLCYQDKHGNKKYCCLGVLADLEDPDGWEKIPSQFSKFGDIAHRGKTDIPNKKVCRGIPPTVDIPHLTSLNDKETLEFIDIANFLEDRFKGVIKPIPYNESTGKWEYNNV